MNIRITKYFAAFVASAAMLAGCGGSGGDSGATTGTLTFNLTDNAINAKHVWIEFTGLEVKLAGDGPAEPYPFDANACDPDKSTTGTCVIDLLTLTGTEHRTIFAEEMPVGDVAWVRLMVNAERNELDSFIEVYDEAMENVFMCPLWIPSGANTGLKLVGGITVTPTGSTYMLDFDVRKSITQPPGLARPPSGDATVADMCIENYVLKPAIRIVDETEAGSIAGVIDDSWFYTLNDQNEEVLADGCREDMNGVVDFVQVYAFEDFDMVGPGVLDDYDGDMDPVAYAKAEYDMDTMTYSYEIGHLLAGNYQLGLTCTGDVDVDTEDNFGCDVQDDNCIETDPPFDFLTDRSVDVQVGVNNGDFPPATP